MIEVRRLAASGVRVAVVVKRTDRLGRDVPEASRARKEPHGLGVEIHMIDDGELIADPPAHIYMAVAQDESKSNGERVADVRSNLVLAGWFYGRRPFGYRARALTDAEQALRAPLGKQHSDRWVPTTIEPNPVTRNIVVDLFQRVADGASVRSTARWLANQSYTTRGGRAWSHNSFVELLRSPTYIARPCQGPDDVLSRPVARWEPLVSDELWMTVQQRMSGHAKRGRYPSSRFLWTGFLRCARCGSRTG
ncbi:MAG TPA: recombinase family protein [Chloroflexota bacterium]|nr:recombinase family protein [Chloroflexota bacterium]